MTLGWWTYDLFGMRLSINRMVPGLHVIRDEGAHDIAVEYLGYVAPAPQPEGADPGEDNRFVLSAWTVPEPDGPVHYLRFSRQTVVDFEINPGLNQIRITWNKLDLQLVDVDALLLGPVLGALIRLRGTLALHASVVRAGNSAIAVAGAKGAGKSTLVAALHQRGHALIADDIAALVETGRHFLVQPGIVRLRLWPSSIATLYGTSAAHPRVMSVWDKRIVDLGGADTIPAEPLPLRAVFVLDPIEARDDISIDSTTPGRGLAALARHTAASFLKLPRAIRARELEGLGRLATTVPVRHVRRPYGLNYLPDTCDAIIEDIGRLSCLELSLRDLSA
jgi:hypothetical protein